HEERWDLRGVGKWFIEPLCEARDEIQRSLWLDVNLGVIGAEMLRYSFRIRCFVVARFVEPDGEGFYWPRALLLHQRDDRRAVDPARQEGAERHVRDEPPTHSVRQKPIKLVY